MADDSNPKAWEPPPLSQPRPSVDDLCRPYDPDGEWKLRLTEVKIPLPTFMGTYAHLALQAVSPDGRVAMEFNGHDTFFGKKSGLDRVNPENKLEVAVTPGAWELFGDREQRTIKTLEQGSYNQLRPALETLYAASQEIQANKQEYIGYAVFSQPQNSNSVGGTLSHIIGHDLGGQPSPDSNHPGVKRRLPTGMLDQIVLEGRVNPESLDGFYKGLAQKTGDKIAVPDFSAIGATPMHSDCQLPENTPLGTVYNPDGTTEPVQKGGKPAPLHSPKL